MLLINFKVQMENRVKQHEALREAMISASLRIYFLSMQRYVFLVERFVAKDHCRSQCRLLLSQKVKDSAPTKV